jgi:hypothetical protein
MEDSRAQTIGIPGAYDYGCQRISWLDNVVTNGYHKDGYDPVKNRKARLTILNRESLLIGF